MSDERTSGSQPWATAPIPTPLIGTRHDINPFRSLFHDLGRMAFDVSAPPRPTTALVPPATGSSIVDGARGEKGEGPAKSNVSKRRRGVASRSTSREPALDATGIHAVQETDSLHGDHRETEIAANVVPAEEVGPDRPCGEPQRRRRSLLRRDRASAPRSERSGATDQMVRDPVEDHSEPVPDPLGVTDLQVAAPPQAAPSPADRFEAPPPRHPPPPPPPMAPPPPPHLRWRRPPPPPPPLLEMPPPEPLAPKGRAPVDLAASAAMAKDILAASEERPPPPPPGEDARSAATAPGPDADSAEQTEQRAPGSEGSKPGVPEDSSVTSDFFASTRGKKRFRRQ